MRKINVKFEDIKFDRFNRHHITMHGNDGYGAAALFVDTNEFMYMRGNARPEARRPIVYGKQPLGMRIVGTTDYGCRYDFKLPDGSKLPITHLNRHGMHDLLVDEDTGMAVAISKGYRVGDNKEELQERADKAMPQWIRQHAQVYISGPGEPPVGPPVPIYPTRKIEKEHRAHLVSLVAASKAWWALKRSTSDDRRVLPGRGLSAFDPRLSSDFDELSEEVRMCLAGGGYEAGFETIYVSHLWV